MSDLLRSIMDIRKGLWQPHDPAKVFKMNNQTYEQLLRVFNQATFIDASIGIEIDPTLEKDAVVKLPATLAPSAPATGRGDTEG